VISVFQTELKEALRALFEGAKYLTDTPPKFILNDTTKNKQFTNLFGAGCKSSNPF
jgi:hypothetical protein